MLADEVERGPFGPALTAWHGNRLSVMMDTISLVPRLVGFAAAWAAASLLMALLGGWSSLGRSYRGRLAAVTGRVWMGSGSISRFGIPIRYVNGLNVAVG